MFTLPLSLSIALSALLSFHSLLFLLFFFFCFALQIFRQVAESYVRSPWLCRHCWTSLWKESYFNNVKSTQMVFLMVLAAVLWGTTNPLLKYYSRGLPSSSSVVDDVLFLLKRPKYLCTQLLNLVGSVVFFYSLRDINVSVGSIVVNSLTFVITVLVSIFVLREGPLRRQTALGCLCVVVGTALCTISMPN